MANTYT